MLPWRNSTHVCFPVTSQLLLRSYGSWRQIRGQLLDVAAGYAAEQEAVAADLVPVLPTGRPVK